MRSSCETIYLDENNKKASVYYNNLHLGHDIAYKQYLKYMKGKANTVLSKQKNVSLDDIYYQSKNDKLEGVRKLINESQTDIMSDGKIHTIAENIVYKMKAKELIISSPYKYNYTAEQANSIITDNDKIIINSKALDDAKEFYDDNKELLESSINTVKSNWNFHTEAGSKIDEHVSNFFTLYNKKLKENKTEPVIKDILDELDLSDIATDDSKNAMKENIIKIFKATKKFIDNKGIKNYDIIPRFQISNEALKMQGVMDLVIHDLDNNRVIVIDWKFKEKGKESLFNSTALGRMSGPFKALFNNKKSQAELQLTGYKLLLEKAGIPINNIDIYVAPLIGKPIKEKGKIVDYESIELPKFEPLTYQRSLFGKFLKTKRNIDIDETFTKEEGKHNSTKDLLLDLTNGQSQPVSFDINSDANYILKHQVKNDPITGKDYFRNTFTDKKEEFRSNDIEDRKEQVKEYLKNKYEDKDRLANNLIEYFNYREWPGKQDAPSTQARSLQATQLLEGLDPKDYTLQQVKNIYGFEDTDPNILVAINSKTGDARLIHATVERDLPIDLGKNRTTIFGKYLEDNTVSTYKFSGLPSTKNNFKLVELGILALKLKDRNFINTVETLFVGSINGNVNQTNAPSVSYMSDMIPQLEVIRDITEDNLSTSLKNLLINKNLKSEDYKVDSLKEFMNLISISSSYKPLKNSDFKNKIKDAYDAYLNEEINRKDFLNKLDEAQKIMYASLKPTIVANNPLLLAKNREYSLLCEAILDVAEFSIDPGALNRKRKTIDQFNLYGNHDNPLMQQVYMLDQTAQQEVVRRFEQFYSEHKKLVKALREDYNKRNPNLKATIVDRDQYKIFADLYIEDPNKELKDYNNAFKLKDPNDPKNNLTKAQKDYINFFNEKIKSGFALSLSSSQMENFNELWEKGTVPILRSSSENKTSRAVGFKNKMVQWRESLKYQGVKRAKDAVDSLFYSISDEFSNQLNTDSGAQGSKSRRLQLGIDNDGKLIDKSKLEGLETNLEQVINKFMLENLMGVAYQSTFAVYNALQVKLLLEQDEHYKPTEDISKAIDKYIKLMIFNEFEDDGKAGERLDMMKNVANKVVMGASAKQFLMESGQNTLASLSLVLNSSIAKMLNSNDAFVKNPASIAKAAQFTAFDSARNDKNAKIAKAIENEFKLYNADLESSKSKEFQETKKHGIFQSKWLMFLNALPYRNAVTQSFFVKLADDGILEAYTEKDGKAVYDVTKDKRFSEIFENGKLKENIKTDKGLDQLAYYKSLEKDLIEEFEGINEKGLINRPYSDKEIVVIKDYLMKAYGSMDRNGKIELQEKSIGRALLMYKSWLPAKIGNYWSPGALRESKGKRVKVYDSEDPNDFHYEFQAQWDEGIIQTLVFVYSQVVDAYKNENKKFYKGLKPGNYSMHQKANIRKLLSDLSVLAGMLLIIMTAIESDIFNTPRGKYFLKIANQSIADLNMYSISNSVMTNGPFAMYGFIQRTVSNLTSSLYYFSTGDFDKALEQGAKLSGATNFLYNSI